IPAAQAPCVTIPESSPVGEGTKTCASGSSPETVASSVDGPASWPGFTLDPEPLASPKSLDSDPPHPNVKVASAKGQGDECVVMLVLFTWVEDRRPSPIVPPIRKGDIDEKANRFIGALRAGS